MNWNPDYEYSIGGLEHHWDNMGFLSTLPRYRASRYSYQISFLAGIVLDHTETFEGKKMFSGWGGLR